MVFFCFFFKATNYRKLPSQRVKTERCHKGFCCVTVEQSLSPSSVRAVNCNSERLPIFTPAESLQAVRAGVPGLLQREEDALHDPAQTFSQWAQEGIQSLPNLTCFYGRWEVKSCRKVLPYAEELLWSSGGDTSGVEQARC